MIEESPRSNQSRSFVSSMQTTIRNGVTRYKSLARAQEARTLLVSFLMSFIGYRMITVALVVMAFNLSGGALGVGAMLAFQMIPGIVLQPISGSLVDRFTGKRLLVLCQFAMVITIVSFMLLLRYESIWLLYAFTFVRGVVNTFDIPGYELRLIALTPREKRGTANAVQALFITIGDVTGPLLAGLIIALTGPEPVFLLAAAVYLVYGIIILRLPERIEGTSPQTDDDAQSANESAEADRLGYRGILMRPTVGIYLASVSASYMVLYGVIPLFIVRSLELGMTEASVGVFFAVMGIGGVLGNIIGGMGTYTTSQALTISGLSGVVGAILLILFGIAGVPVLAFAMLLLVGVAAEVEEIPSLTYFQNSLPESIYGRFFSGVLMVGYSGGLGGSLLAPLRADRFNTGVALSVIAIPWVITGILLANRGSGFRLGRSPFAMAAAPGIVAAPIITNDHVIDEIERQINAEVLNPGLEETDD